MASVHRKNGDKTWQVFWRDPGGKQHAKRGFATKRDANAYGVRMEASKLDGSYVDAIRGKVTFGDCAMRWLAIQPHRPQTALSVESGLRNHVLPALGHRPIGAIEPSEVQAAVARWSVSLSPGTVRNLVNHTTAVFSEAVADRRIARSPAVKLKLPSSVGAQVEPMTVAQVAQMASAVPQRYRALIVAAAGTGARQGELLGLSADRIDWMRRTIRIDRQLVTTSGPPTFGPPKNQKSSRTIGAPDEVLAELSAHMAIYPLGMDGLVFTNDDGNPIRRNGIGHVWRRAAPSAGITDHTFHDLRHFCASGLIAAGCSVVAVQRHLGHASAKVTLDTYSHLWPDDGDRTRAALSSLLGLVSPPLAGEVSS